MKVNNFKKLEKLKFKNKGNIKLIDTIDHLRECLDNSYWKTQKDIIKDRKDADCVHSDGFYFFNTGDFRVLVLVELDKSMVDIIWTGSHDDYEMTFKNNKETIRKWLRDRGLVK